jgi:serine protease Do
MSEGSNQKLFKRMLIAGASATALFLGFAAAPTLSAVKADARQIVVQPPQGAPMSFADLVERVSPAVVSIQVRTKPQANDGFGGGDLPPGFEEFLRRNPEFRQQRREGQSLGSGFVIAENGTIVTNHHVVDDAVEITVRTSDRKEYKAEVVGSDVGTDLAVLRIKDAKGQRFPFVAFDRSASTNVRVGDWVVAVGNPFGLEGTATAGIVSAKGRREGGSSYVDFLQIDAPINRGNSGGPTFDLRGQVIGMNSMIFSPSGGSVGIGVRSGDCARGHVPSALAGPV